MGHKDEVDYERTHSEAQRRRGDELVQRLTMLGTKIMDQTLGSEQDSPLEEPRVVAERETVVEISNEMEKDGEKEARKSAEGESVPASNRQMPDSMALPTALVFGKGESEKEPEVQDTYNGVVDDMDSGEVWVRQIGVGEVSGKEKDKAGEDEAGEDEVWEDKALEDETGVEAGKGKNKRKGKGENKKKVKSENNEMGWNAKKRKACDDDAPEEIDHNSPCSVCIDIGRECVPTKRGYSCAFCREGKRKCNLSNVAWRISSKQKKLKMEGSRSNPPALTKSNSPPEIVAKSQPPRAAKPQPTGPPTLTSLSLTSKQIQAPDPRSTRSSTSRKLLGDLEDPQNGEGRAASGEKLNEENTEMQEILFLKAEVAHLKDEIPHPDEIPNIDLEVRNYHQTILGTFHAKFAIIDRKFVIINSNDRVNMEMMCHIEGPIVESFYDMALLSWSSVFNPPLPLLSSPPTPSEHYKFGNEHAHIAAKDLETAKFNAAGIAQAAFDVNDAAEKNNNEKGLHNKLAAITQHLNTTLQPDTKATLPEGVDMDNFSPHILHGPHDPFPIAMVNPRPRGSVEYTE
ncbi:hypothetical protein CPB84DRAFT_1851962 [Gymnopilus junonius]|uniref:Uncharacterized protein n=1 Tax=Gymnopilus junonius TaxID=109634 RepID=A0A9P5NBC4_GYMJU|nr:hypothetical protein CPB84DRAFT_1851962 [Gymnopilus junonius]